MEKEEEKENYEAKQGKRANGKAAECQRVPKKLPVTRL